MWPFTTKKLNKEESEAITKLDLLIVELTKKKNELKKWHPNYYFELPPCAMGFSDCSMSYEEKRYRIGLSKLYRRIRRLCLRLCSIFIRLLKRAKGKIKTKPTKKLLPLLRDIENRLNKCSF